MRVEELGGDRVYNVGCDRCQEISDLEKEASVFMGLAPACMKH